MLESVVTVNNALGLHARAAAQLVRLAGRYGCEITLTRHDNRVSVNAKSILSVLSIAAAYGVTLTIVTNGNDENEAMAAVEKLFLDGFGEL